MAEQGHELTIDRHAQETGMSARNIRAHQSRGLLAPPDAARPHGAAAVFGPALRTGRS